MHTVETVARVRPERVFRLADYNRMFLLAAGRVQETIRLRGPLPASTKDSLHYNCIPFAWEIVHEAIQVHTEFSRRKMSKMYFHFHAKYLLRNGRHNSRNYFRGGRPVPARNASPVSAGQTGARQHAIRKRLAFKSSGLSIFGGPRKLPRI